MNIIPTKKAFPLFSAFPESQNKVPDADRSFYSWHANYFTLNRKKILVLVNDQSFSPIVLADINAKNKKDLDAMIKAGIEEVFSYSDIPPVQIKKYFLKAGRIEIASKHNRSIISINNHLIQHTRFFAEDIHFQTNLQPMVMKHLAQTPYRSQTSAYAISTEVVATELKKLI